MDQLPLYNGGSKRKGSIMTFEIWMQQVDTHFIKNTDMGCDDWADNCYYDMWEEGMSPYDAMVDTIEREYGEEGLEAFGLEV